MSASRLCKSISASLLALALTACGQAGLPQRMATATTRSVTQQEPTTVAPYQRAPLPHGWTLVTYSAAIPYSNEPAFHSQPELRVTAGCHSGERMVGAGYAATDVFEYNARITSSYPIDDHMWTATGGTQAGLQLDVYCLRGDHLPPVVIVSGPSGGVACPAGSVALAGGFGPPSGGGSARTVYALCATSGAQAGSRATAPITFNSNQNGYMPVSGAARCPAGQIAFGGGVTGVDVASYFASGATADFAGWAVAGGGGGSGVVYASCVRLF